jgi:hypothetical protein
LAKRACLETLGRDDEDQAAEPEVAEQEDGE